MISRKNYTPTPVGSAVINADGSTSTCSAANYFEVYPVPAWQAGYVLQLHLKWGGSTGSYYYAISSYNTSDKTIFLNASYLYLYKDNGVSNGSISGLGLSSNTEYWIRLSWTGTVYTVEKSTDGVTFTTVGSYSSSTALNTGKLMWFGRASNNYSFGGMFYFEDTWLKNGNGQIVWSAAELADASGNVAVTEGYYNSGTYILTPPFIKTAFADLVSNQTIACKNNIFLREISADSYDYVLNSTASPAGTSLHAVDIGDVYLSPGKDYLLSGSQKTDYGFTLDSGNVQNTVTGWFYDDTTQSTYHLDKALSKDITALFQGQQKSTSNTLYIANEVVSTPLLSNYLPPIQTSYVGIWSKQNSSKYSFVTSSTGYAKTTDGLTFEDLPDAGLIGQVVVSDGANKVFVCDTTNSTYQYSTDGGDTFVTGVGGPWDTTSISSSVHQAGAAFFVNDGTNWYATTDFINWATFLSSDVNAHVVYANGNYIFYEVGSTAYTLSADTNFNSFQILSFNHDTDGIVAFDDALYARRADDSGYMYSTDGSTWTDVGSARCWFSVAGDRLYIEEYLSGNYTISYIENAGDTWTPCTGYDTSVPQPLPTVKLGDYYITNNLEMASADDTFSTLDWIGFSVGGVGSMILPSGDLLVFINSQTGALVVPPTIKRTSITASSDPDNLSGNYVDYVDSGYTVTLNAALDTIESVSKNA